MHQAPKNMQPHQSNPSISLRMSSLLNNAHCTVGHSTRPFFKAETNKSMFFVKNYPNLSNYFFSIEEYDFSGTLIVIEIF